MAKLKDKIKDAFTLALKLQDTQLMHYASSLSFHTIISIVPVLLLSLSVFTKLPVFENYYVKIKELIFNSLLPTHQEEMGKYLDIFLQNSISLGIIGFVGIIFTSIMFFVDYEYVVNKIMKTKSRNFWNSLSSYWTLITLAPLGLAFSFYLSNIFQNLLNSTSYTSWINFLSIFPYLIIWVIFCVTYLISINKSISFKNALFSSFIASFSWYISKTLFVYYAIYNKTYLSIYGSFSIMFFFFLWIYISWIIFLYGLKLCGYLDEKENLKAS